MKKLRWLVGMALILLIGGVHAASNDTTVNIDYWNDVYGNFLIGQEYYWNQMGITYANGKLAYCLEPGKWITESTYDSYTDFNVKNFSDELKQRLELIAYYGYEYKNHQTKQYYLATQELIWRELGIGEMYWTTGSVHGGDRINVDHEINTIRELINSHYNMPSFHDKTYEMRSGEELRLEDTNYVFEDYEVLPPAEHGTTIAGNNLFITANKVGNSTLSFIRNPNAYRASFIYTKNDSQAIATFGLSNKIVTKVHLKVNGYTLELNKKDFDHKSEIPSGGASLKGAIYQITDNLMFLKTIETDETGHAFLKDIPAGTYEVKEIKASPGYEIDPNIYTIHVGIDTALMVNLDVYEKVIENEIEFIKVMSNGETGIMEPEENVTFGIYTKEGELVSEVTTNKQGTAKVKLPYGTYIVKQLTTTPNYEKVKEYEIHIREKTEEPIRYVMNDMPIQAKVKIIKEDEFGNPIKEKGIIFKIRNVDTQEYVRQKIEYPEEMIIDEFMTNEDGEVVTPYPLEAGNYELEEIKSPKGYLLPESPFPFILNENTAIEHADTGNIITLHVTNKTPKGEIVITKYGRSMELVKNEMGMYDQTVKEELLSGVKFGLYAGDDIRQNDGVIYHTGELVGEFQTVDGMIRISELPLGTYCIKELESLPGYKIEKDAKCITLEYQDPYTKIITENIDIINERVNHQAIVKKYGENMISFQNQSGFYEKVPLSGITFLIIANEEIQLEDHIIAKDTVLYERVTDSEGIIQLENLPVGIYRIHEKETPENYEKMDDVVFSITETSQIEQVDLINTRKKGNITVVKVDSDTNLPLDGAVFRLYDRNKKVLIDHIIAKKGIIKLENIAFGEYYLEEVKAPNGYIKERGEKLIHVNQKKMKSISFENHRSILPNTSSIYYLLYFIIAILGIICGGTFLISFILRKRYGK